VGGTTSIKSTSRRKISLRLSYGGYLRGVKVLINKAYINVVDSSNLATPTRIKIQSDIIFNITKNVLIIDKIALIFTAF